MRLHWFGHSAFLIEASDGLRIIFDPYTAGGYEDRFRYDAIDARADIVLASHEHTDHFDPSAVGGDPLILTEPGYHAISDLTVIGVETSHDAHGGAERGKNTAWRLEVDDLACAHLGDLGAPLTDAQAGAIGPVDVLMVPVGGKFTIDARQAHDVMHRLARHVIVPMHYRTDKVDFPIAPVDPFLDGPQPVVKVGGPDLMLFAGDLPPTPTIYVLEHSR